MPHFYKRPWWGAPKNFDDRKKERKVSWLELFYDLVYVAAISQLIHQLTGHLSWNTLGYSFVLFCMIFWSWVNGSQYYDLHGSDSIRTRLLTFWQMLGLAGVAIAIHDAYEGHYQPITLAFIFLQLFMTYLWWSVGFWDPSHRVFSRYYTTNYLIAFMLLVLSLFVPEKYIVLIWIGVLVLNFSPGLIGHHTIVTELKKRGQVFSASLSIVERFGLFTIIVLAESILGTIGGVAEIKDREPMAWLAFALGILVSFLLWSLYFDMTSEQETKNGHHNLQWLIFLHLPLLFGLGVVGACIRLMTEDPSAYAHIHPLVSWTICLAVAIILLMIVSLTRIMKEEEEDRAYIRPVTRILVPEAVLIIFLPLVAGWLNTVVFLFLLVLLLLIPVVLGIYGWIRYKMQHLS